MSRLRMFVLSPLSFIHLNIVYIILYDDDVWSKLYGRSFPLSNSTALSRYIFVGAVAQ